MAPEIDPSQLVIETAFDSGQAEEGFASLLKSMSENSAETSKYLRDLGVNLKDLVETVISKTQDAQGNLASATESVGKQQKTIQQSLAELKTETEKSLGDIEKLYEDYGIKATGSLEQAARAYEGAIKKVKEDAVKGIISGPEAKSLLGELESDIKTVYKKIEEQKKAGLSDLFKGKGPEVSLLGDAKTSVGAVTSSIMDAIPEMVLKGGLVGLLLYGLTAAEASRVQISTVAHDFRTEVSQTTEQIVGNVGVMTAVFDGAAKSMHVSGEEFSGVYRTLAQAGVSAEKAGFSIGALEAVSDGLGVSAASLADNLGALSIAVDKSFNLPIGTTVKDAANVSKDLGISVQQATEQMAKLRLAAKGSDEDMGRYISTVMTASKSLGQFGIDLGAATELMGDFVGQDKAMGGTGARAARAMEGVGQLFSGIKGNVGMAAYMGERVFKREHPGEQIDPLEARRRMLLSFGQAEGAKEGSAEYLGGRKAFADVLMEVQSMARSSGGTKAQQEFLIEKQFGVDTVTANMIMGLNKTQLADLRAGKTPSGLKEKDLETLKAGLQTSKERENSFQEFIKSILSAIKDLMIGLLQGIGALVTIAVSPLSGREAAGAALKAMQARFANAAEGLGESGMNLLTSTGKLMNIGGKQVPDYRSPSERKKDEEDKKLSDLTAKVHSSGNLAADKKAAYDAFTKPPTSWLAKQEAAGASGTSGGHHDSDSASSSGVAQSDPTTGGMKVPVMINIPPQVYGTMMKAQQSRR